MTHTPSLIRLGRRFLHYALPALWLGLLPATALQAQSVSDILQLVEQRNLELQALTAANQQQNLEDEVENAMPAPSIEYSPFLQRGAGGLASSELVISQSFDLPPIRANQRKQRRLAGNVRTSQRNERRQQLLLQAQLLCFDIIHLNRQMALENRRLSLADSLCLALKNALQQGRATALELNQAQRMQIQARRQIAQTKEQLTTFRRQLGLLADTDSLEGPNAQTSYPEVSNDSLLHALQAAPTQSPAIQTARQSIQLAQTEQRNARLSWLPELQLGYRRNTEGPGMPAAHGLLIGASIPIYSASRKQRISRLNLQQQELQLRQAQRQLAQQNQDKLTQLRRLQRQLDDGTAVLAREGLTLLLHALQQGQISLVQYCQEADPLYAELQDQLQIERQYHGLVAEICQSNL